MEWEGKKKDHFHCFSVVDRSGLSLMRMSTSDANDAAVWVQVCLQHSDSMHAKSDHCTTLLPFACKALDRHAASHGHQASHASHFQHGVACLLPKERLAWCIDVVLKAFDACEQCLNRDACFQRAAPS